MRARKSNDSVDCIYIYAEAAEALDETSDGAGVSIFNDTHTHAEVLALFDRTIARLEAEQRA